LRKLFGYACKLAELGTTCKIWTTNLVNCLWIVNGFGWFDGLFWFSGLGGRDGFLAFFKDKRVVVALNLENAAVALAFTFCDRIHFVPSFKKFAVLLGKLDAVGLFHIKVDAGDESTYFFSRLGFFHFEVDNGFAFSVHRGWGIRPLAEHKVVAVAVDFSNGGVEVVQVAFHYFECSVVCAAVLASAVTPAGEVLPHVVRSDNVFPFNAFGAFVTFAVRVFTRFVIATAEIDVLFVDVPAIAVERSLEVSVIDAFHLFARIAVVVMFRCGFWIDFRGGRRCENTKNQSDSAC